MGLHETGSSSKSTKRKANWIKFFDAVYNTEKVKYGIYLTKQTMVLFLHDMKSIFVMTLCAMTYTMKNHVTDS
jgi:hypothetical protein